MTVSTFILPTAVDGDLSVLARLAGAFAPHESSTPSMAVVVDPGHIMAGTSLVEVGSQLVSGIVAPVSHPRIDRVVIATSTGVASLIIGTESASPVPPPLSAGVAPVASIALVPAMAVIANADITDERDFSGLSRSSGALLNVQTFAASGTYVPTPGTTSIVVEVQGGGGSGGGSAATSGSQGAAAGGGSAGAFAKARFTSGFSGASVTVGAGGATTAAAAVNGNAGGTSSFGALVSAPGGRGGFAGSAFAPPALVGASGSSLVATGGNLVNGAGATGERGLLLGLFISSGGAGGASSYGGGSAGSGNAAGTAAVTPGAGGGGASGNASSSARAGGAGAPGLVTIYEYL